jgi:hypothetical protein
VLCDAFNPAWPLSTQPLQHCCVAVLAVCAQWVISGGVVAGTRGWLGWVPPCKPFSGAHKSCMLAGTVWPFWACTRAAGSKCVHAWLLFGRICVCLLGDGGMSDALKEWLLWLAISSSIGRCLWCQLVGATMSARTQAAAIGYGWAVVGSGECEHVLCGSRLGQDWAS